jgi:hypothetical protein
LLVKLGSNKHSSLLGPFLSYKENYMFLTLT